jgi:hypothetical protein
MKPPGTGQRLSCSLRLGLHVALVWTPRVAEPVKILRWTSPVSLQFLVPLVFSSVFSIESSSTSVCLSSQATSPATAASTSYFSHIRGTATASEFQGDFHRSASILVQRLRDRAFFTVPIFTTPICLFCNNQMVICSRLQLHLPHHT